ncbi:MAG: glycosyltransferase family 2 protein [Thiohalomonas sp.]|nr:glycosyltransferase family 2 protein [Thiohalomonas sp.]
MIYVILVNYNNSDDSIECLTSLMTIVNTEMKVIVVDNHSVLEQCYILKSYIEQFSNIELIENNKNSGFSGGCNTALKEVLQKENYDYIWLLNNDTIVTPETLSPMIETIQNNPLIGVCGSQILDYSDKNKVQSLGGTINPFFSTTKHITCATKLTRLDYIVGASILINKNCIKSVGLLSEEYFLYYEDVDYSLRVKNEGFSLAVSLDSIVYHKEGAASNVSKGNYDQKHFIDLLQIQNRKVFARKFGFNKSGLYFGIVLAVLNRLRRGQYNQALKVFALIFKDFNWKKEQLSTAS